MPESGVQAPAPQLRRELGILQATSINMSNMIGIGPFITVPVIVATLGGPQSLLSWGVGAVLALCDGLVVAELGAALPGSGGSYVFLRDSLGSARWGRLMAWMFIWQFLFSGPLEIASAGIGMMQYLSYLFPPLAFHPLLMKLAAGMFLPVDVKHGVANSSTAPLRLLVMGFKIPDGLQVPPTPKLMLANVDDVELRQLAG
jgi:amino acid transporter